MTALRICNGCDRESSLFEARKWCCGESRYTTAWECNGCAVRAPRESEGWRASQDHHLCAECAPAPQQQTQTRRRVRKTKDEGGLF